MCTSDEVENCTDGYLWKKIMFGFWSKRYCKLKDNRFEIYKKETDKKPEQTVIMSSLVLTEITDAVNNKFRIKIPKTSIFNEKNLIGSKSEPNLNDLSESKSDSIIYLQASNKNDMMKWILDLRICSYINPELSMDMFDILSVIGRGRYGKVMLCQKKDTQEIVAIKSVHKADLVESQKLYTILTERNILAKVKHPFIISLKYAFQTSAKFYLCLEYAPGGDLFHLLCKGIPPKDDIKLYIAEIALAIEELHFHGIIYRDLKSENVLFDSKGHIKITDFGLSKLFDSKTIKSSDGEDLLHQSQPQTLTFCGTSEYIAPEMIKKTGYSFSIDWWSLGILTYEMFFGMTPFESQNKNQMYQNILKGDIYFPSDADKDVKEFIQMLLQRNPKKRGDFESIKSSNLMKDVNFDLVYQKEIPMLHRPFVSDRSAKINFDSEFTKEEAFDSDLEDEESSPMVSDFSYSCLNDEEDEVHFLGLNHSRSVP